MCLPWQNAWEMTFPKQGLEWNDWCQYESFWSRRLWNASSPKYMFGMTFTGALLDCRKGSEQNWLEMYLSFIMTSWKALIFTVSVIVSGKCLCSPRLSQELVNIWDRFGQVFLFGFAKGSEMCVWMLGCFPGDLTDRLCSKFWVLGSLWFAGESWPWRRKWQDESTSQKHKRLLRCWVKPEPISGAGA